LNSTHNHIYSPYVAYTKGGYVYPQIGAVSLYFGGGGEEVEVYEGVGEKLAAGFDLVPPTADGGVVVEDSTGGFGIPRCVPICHTLTIAYGWWICQ
jgi:hypothetical protein